MKKFIAALIAAVAMMVVMSSPAHAATKALTCTYDNGSVTRIGSAHMGVSTLDSDRFNVSISMYDPNMPNREWQWKMKHNGDFSALGTQYGSFNVAKTMVDFAGSDTIYVRVENAVNSVVCQGTMVV